MSRPSSHTETTSQSLNPQSYGPSLINPLRDDWDKRVTSHRAATFFHSAAWARVLHATYGYTPHYSVFEQADSPATFLPTMAVSSWLTGRRGVSLPFTDELEPIGDEPALFAHRFRRVLEYAKAQRWKYYELRGGRTMLGEVSPSVSFHGHTLPLQSDTAAIFAKCLGAARTAVRKGEQAGLTIEFSQSWEATRSFYDLICQTRSRHGTLPQPIPFFEHIQREILAKNLGTVVLAKLGTKPVGGAMFFHFNQGALYKFAASDVAYRSLCANNLILWRAIEHYARQGFVSMDFGRTSLDNVGLRKFKLSWGAKERQIDYVRYECATDRFVTSTDRSSGWQQVIFRALPPALSRPLGALIYRHLG